MNLYIYIFVRVGGESRKTVRELGLESCTLFSSLFLDNTLQSFMPGRHGAPWTNGPPPSLISRRFNVFNPAKIVDNLLLPILGVLSSLLSPPPSPQTTLRAPQRLSTLPPPSPELCFYHTLLAHLPPIYPSFVSKSSDNGIFQSLFNL